MNCDQLPTEHMQKVCRKEIPFGNEQQHRALMQRWFRKHVSSGITIPGGMPSVAAEFGVGVGTLMEENIAWLTRVKPTGSTCLCTTLRDEMNNRGPKWCQENREALINRVIDNAQTIELDGVKKWAQSLLLWSAAEYTARKAVGKMLDNAIKKSLDSRKPVNKIAPTRVLSRGPFSMVEGPIKFITSQQFQRDILRLSQKVPEGTDAIVGVARSGLAAATMVAMYRHLPLFIARQSKHDIIPAGNGWRLNGKLADPKSLRVVVVDDTVMTGNSTSALSNLVRNYFGEVYTSAVYVNPRARTKPDFWVQDLPWPHLLEWNLFNSVLSPVMAMDFDGILCRDCYPQEDDDGPKYMNFLQKAEPRYLSRKVMVPLIVTARLERYRVETEAWLKRHKVRVRKLVMHPAKTLRERRRDNIAAFKAKHYAEWACDVHSRMKPIAFIESDDRQAQEIAHRSGRICICPLSGKVYGG